MRYATWEQVAFNSLTFVCAPVWYLFAKCADTIQIYNLRKIEYASLVCCNEQFSSRITLENTRLSESSHLAAGSHIFSFLIVSNTYKQFHQFNRSILLIDHAHPLNHAYHTLQLYRKNFWRIKGKRTASFLLHILFESKAMVLDIVCGGTETINQIDIFSSIFSNKQCCCSQF